MKFVFGGFKALAFIITLTGISFMLVIGIYSSPQAKVIQEAMNINGFEIKANMSDRGATYYLNSENPLSNQEVVVIGFTILDNTNEQVYLTVENNREIILLTVNTDYQATIVKVMKI